MTFVNLRTILQRELTPKDLESLSRLSTVYGMRGFSFEGHDLIVEYDASRLHEAEVLAEIRDAGIPVEPPKPIPEGSFDQTGEFHDYAWPTQGPSPANQKIK
jgi:hypothetical protein